MDESEIQKRKSRWKRVYAGEESPKHLLMVRYYNDQKDVGPSLLPYPELHAARLERAWKVYNHQVEHLSWLKDDTIPWVDCMTGTEIFAAAFGCPVHRPKDNMPFALPLVNNASDAAKVKVPSLDASPLRMAFEMADELVRRAGKGTLVRPVDIQSPMDIAALIWEKADFLLAMIESPEAVKELAHKCRELLTMFLDEWHRRYGKEHIAHFPEYYMPDGITLSEDEIGVVNNDMFEEFFLPELVYLSEHFGAIGIHCCADSRHQWKSFAKIPNLRFLNLKAELADRAYGYFSGTGVLQLHLRSPENWDKVMAEHPKARLCIDVKAETKEEAIALVEKYRCD